MRLTIQDALAAILGLIIPIMDSLDNLWHHHEGFDSSSRLRVGCAAGRYRGHHRVFNLTLLLLALYNFLCLLPAQQLINPQRRLLLLLFTIVSVL